MEDYGDLYDDITLRRTVSGRHIKSGSAESANEDDFEVTRSVYEQSVQQQQQQQPHHPRRMSKKAWAAIIATALVALGAIGYCTHELVSRRNNSSIQVAAAKTNSKNTKNTVASEDRRPTLSPSPTISPMPTDQFGNTAGIKPDKNSKESAQSGDGPKPENTKPNNSKESAQSGDGPKPDSTKPNNSKESAQSGDGPSAQSEDGPKPKPDNTKPINSKSKESNPSEDTPPVAPIEPDSTRFPSPPTYKPTLSLMPSFGGTVTVSTEVTAPPTVAGRSDEPV